MLSTELFYTNNIQFLALFIDTHFKLFSIKKQLLLKCMFYIQKNYNLIKKKLSQHNNFRILIYICKNNIKGFIKRGVY